MVSRNPRRAIPALLCLVFAIATCDSPARPDNGLRTPPRTDDGWQTASLESVGMDVAPLQRLLERISNTDNHMIHSLLIVRRQKLVFEAYWPGTDLRPGTLTLVERQFDRETLHYMASVSKSITSILTGIAIDQGAIPGVEEPMFSFFPDYSHLQRGESHQITLEHLLDFSSGFDWNEFVYGFDDPRDSHFQMFDAADPLAWLLARPMRAVPGDEFHYNSGDTNIVGEIVRRTTGSESLAAFADRYLFQPLGIRSFDWTRFSRATQMNFASGGSYLRPRDMAKLGALYLNDGIWSGKRVVSASWVTASTTMSIPLIGNFRTLYGYGYNWWLGRSPHGDMQVEYFRAAGWGGQYVYVFPEMDLVVVFTGGGYYENRPLDTNDLIENYIFEAITDGAS